MGPSDFSSGFPSDFTLCAYTGRFSGCGATDLMRSLLFQQRLSQHPIPHTPEGSSMLLCQGLRIFLGLRLCVAGSAPSGPISGSTFRRRRIHLMLLAVDLRSFLRRIHRFSTTSHLVALDACYLAACSLPGSDFHRLADDSFQDTLRCGLSGKKSIEKIGNSGIT